MLSIYAGPDLLLAIFPDGTVQVPQDIGERAQCYHMLSDALNLLVDTVSSETISAKAGGTGLSVKRIGPHRSDCHEVSGCVLPSARREGSRGHFLRLVSFETIDVDR